MSRTQAQFQTQTQHQEQKKLIIAGSFDYSLYGSLPYPEEIGRDFYDGVSSGHKLKFIKSAHDRTWFHRFASASGNISKSEISSGLATIEEIKQTTNPATLQKALEQEDKFGWKPMHYAAWCGNDSALESLMTAGGRVSDRDMGNALFLATANNRGAKNFKKLCERFEAIPEEFFFTDGEKAMEVGGAAAASAVAGGGGAGGGGGAAAGGRKVRAKNLLDIAAEYGNVEVMEFLLSRGRFSIDGMTNIPIVDPRHSKTVDESNPKVIRGKFQNFDKCPLYMATKGLHTKAVKFLIEQIQEKEGEEVVTRYVAQEMNDKVFYNTIDGVGLDTTMFSLASLAAKQGLRLWNCMDTEYSSYIPEHKDRFLKTLREGFFLPAGYPADRLSRDGMIETAHLLLHFARPARLDTHPYLEEKGAMIAECVVPERVAAYRMSLDMEALFATPHVSPLKATVLDRAREPYPNLQLLVDGPYPNLQLLVELLSIKIEKEKSLLDIALLKVLTAKPGMDTDDEGVVRAIKDQVNDAISLSTDFAPAFRDHIYREMAKCAERQIGKIRSGGAAAPSEGVAAAGHAALGGGGVEEGKEGEGR